MYGAERLRTKVYVGMNVSNVRREGAQPYLVVLRCVLAQMEHRCDAVGEEEPFDVKHLGTFHERGDRRRREMRRLEFPGGTQRRH